MLSAGKFMNDKRIQNCDRRDYTEHLEFQSRDSDNIFVLADRRRAPDRRTHNIEVDWIEEDLVIFP